MMISRELIQQKQSLAELKTFMVLKMGFQYSDKLIKMIDEYRDSLKPDLMSDLDTVVRTELLIEIIREQRRTFKEKMKTMGMDV